MAATFQLTIITPEKTIYNGSATSLVAPGTAGYLGILAHHAPLVATLGPGTITIRDTQATPQRLTSRDGGILHVLNNRVTLLLDTVAT